MNLLLLQDRDDVREKVVFLLESRFNARVDGVSSIDAAEVKIKASSSEPYDLLIVDWKLSDSASVARIRNLILQVPILVAFSAGEEPRAVISQVTGVFNRESLVEQLTLALESLIRSGAISDLRTAQDKVRIRTQLLLQVCPLQGDIYIRLSDQKFVKVFRVGDTFDLTDMEKYTVKKGIEYLYIRKEQCLEFASKYLAELQKIAKTSLPESELVHLNISVHETVQELTRQMGFNREVQEMTRAQVQMTVRTMGASPNLAQILSKLEKSKDKYISAHSTVCAFVACAIAGQLRWGSETTFHKLTLASFLHDMTLENDQLADYNSLADIEKRRDLFSEAEIQAYRDHPIYAAELAKRMNEVPPDVDTIISQHHERPDGTGFPRKLTYSYISPLSTVFIVAHDLTYYALKNQDRFNIDLFIDEVREKYKSSQFKKVLSCIENMHELNSGDFTKPTRA